MSQLRGVLFDIDGTLIDSNDAHARAWVDALAKHGFEVPFEKVRSLIGMGGDKLLPTVTGLESDSPQGKRLSTERGQFFKERYLAQIKAFPHTRDMLLKLREHGLKLVIATSAKDDELKDLLEIAGATDLIAEKASSDDAKESKPDPDIIQAALRAGDLKAEEVVMVGDTPYDIEAARKAGVATVAFRSGGWKDADLQGASQIYDGPADLLSHLEEFISKASAAS